MKFFYQSSLTKWRLTKLLRIMRITTLLLLIGLMQTYATNSYSQNTRLSLKIENASLENILSEIEKVSEFRFFYRSNEIDPNVKHNVDANQQTVDEVLNSLLKDSNLTYKVFDKYIAIVSKESANENAASLFQQKSVSGKVTDISGVPLPGVSVVIKGTTIGTITGADGTFTLAKVPSDATLMFSFIGMKKQEIKVEGKSEITVKLEEETIDLEEVVAVGYGVQNKTTLTGSVTSIANKELKASPSFNVSNTLGGLLTGVITKGATGEPGRDNPVLLIRGRNTTGNNNPLVVVDGVQGVSGWERINSNDIESISVLKDASAAIYGARAANGVILITTKRGSLGKPTINYSFNQAITQPTRIPKMASSAEFAGYVNQLDVEAGQIPRFSEDEIQKFREGTDPDYINEDWYEKVLKKYSFQSQHNLNLRGGSDNVKYSISGSYTSEGSIFKNGSLKYKTYSLRSNVDAQINKNLKVGFDLNGSLDDGNYPAYDVSQTFDELKQVPYLPVIWPNGLPSAGIEYGNNPIVMGTSLTGNENVKTNRYLAKGFFDLTIPWFKGLGVDGYFAYSSNLTTDKKWQTPWTVYDYDKVTDTYIPVLGGGILSPQLTQTFTGSTSTLINLRIKYAAKINGHNLSTFIAVEQSKDISNNFYAFRKNYISSTLDELFAGSLIDQSTGGGRLENGRQNLFGRFNYGFKEKYLLDFNFRYDGSSNFPAGNRFGFFPGISMAWRISQEDFMKNNISFIDNLKLRVSVGKIGNDAIPPFQYLTLYTLGNTGMSFGQPPVATNGLIAGVSPNTSITWEVAKTANIGMDARFWKGLLGFTVDVFKQIRSNILTTRDLAVPVYTGLSLPNENIGTVINKGIELELTHSKVVGDISWRVAANVSYSHNNVVNISESKDIVEWKKQEGHVLGATQYYHAIGIFRTQAEVDAAPIYPGTKVGDLQYQDVDGDGVITANDMYTMDKTSVPEIVFGLNLSLNYKDFSLWANFTGAGNVWQYYHVNARVGMNQLEDVIINRYTPGSMNSKYPRLPTMEAGSAEPDGLRSDFWLKNATYGRLKTLEFSYNLPQNLLSKVKIQSMKIFLNGQNLFTIDNIKWADPENNSIKYSYYPQSKIYNLGINLTF